MYKVIVVDVRNVIISEQNEPNEKRAEELYVEALEKYGNADSNDECPAYKVMFVTLRAEQCL